MSVKENWLFLGNPGVGKSTLLNCLIGRQAFESGVSYAEGLTKHYERVVVDGIAYIDTPGLADVRIIEQAAHEIAVALEESSAYKLFFLVRLKFGRIVEEDLVAIERVLDAVNVNNVSFSVVLNNITKDQFDTLMRHGPEYDLVRSALHACRYRTSAICLVPHLDELEEASGFVARLPNHVYEFMREEAPVMKDEALCNAARAGDIAGVRALLDDGMDVHVRNNHGSTSLHIAAWYGHTDVVRLLLVRHANVEAVDKDGQTALHMAAGKGETGVVWLLLECHANVEAVDKDGHTALHFAAWKGQTGVVRLLLERHANVDAKRQDGQTPLHFAAEKGQMDVVHLLLESSANLNAKDISAATPLESAVGNSHNHLAFLLLERGADIDTRYHTYDFYRPLLLDTINILVESGDSTSAHMLILDHWLRTSLHFVLSCAFDSVQCNLVEEVRLWRQLDELSSKVDAVNVIRRCLDFWQHQIDDAIELTEIPDEVASEGPASVELYISALTDSTSPTYRHKIYVVGPTTAGKTSLIKSLTRGQSTLEEIDTRTVGIDLFSHRFESDGKQHEVTFWDFAGQDVYHAAHTVFFSRRTLFLVVVDLAKYAKVLPHANERAQIAEPRIKRFVDEHVFHWLRLILTRLSDATIAFVGTKTDLVATDTVDDIHADLEGRIARWCEEHNALRMEQQHALKTSYQSVLWLDMREKLTTAFKKWLTVSSTDIHSIQETLKCLEHLIVLHRRGFLMPDTYSSVLERIRGRRESHGSSLALQVKNIVAKKEDVLVWLVLELPILRRRGCELVMRTLHELGDVLWYDVSQVTGTLKDQTCLAPDLVINLVRELISHELFELMSDTESKSDSRNPTSRQMAYQAIRTDDRFPVWQKQLTGSGCVDGGLIERLPLWCDVKASENKNALAALKSLLQHLGLAYPVGDDEAIKRDSSLIFPAYWKMRDAVDLCCDKRHLLSHMMLSTKCSALLYEYAWEYEFYGSYFPPTLFETVIVHTFAPSAKRVVTTPDRVVAVVPDEGVIRLEIVGTHCKKLIRVDVIAVTKELAEKLVLYHCSIVESALAEYPGLDPFVQIVGRDDSEDLEEEKRQELLQAAVVEAPVQKSRPWMWWCTRAPTTKERLPRLCQSTERPVPLHLRIQVCELSWSDTTSSQGGGKMLSIANVKTKWVLKTVGEKSNLKEDSACGPVIEIRDVAAAPVLKLCELRVIVQSRGRFFWTNVLAVGSLRLDSVVPENSLGVFQAAGVKILLVSESVEGEAIGQLKCNIACLANYNTADAA